MNSPDERPEQVNAENRLFSDHFWAVGLTLSIFRTLVERTFQSDRLVQ
jgi:hypothetical protein